MACDHTIGGSGVRTVSVLGEEAELDERARVEEQVDALADRELAALVLLRHLLGSAHREVPLASGPKVLNPSRVVVAHRENPT